MSEEQEAEIVRLRLSEGKTLRQIGEQLGFTISGVSKALKRLREEVSK